VSHESERYVEDFAELERRLANEHPGVQGVIDAYSQAQSALDHLDTHARAIDARPPVVMSNGSLPIVV